MSKNKMTIMNLTIDVTDEVVKRMMFRKEINKKLSNIIRLKKWDDIKVLDAYLESVIIHTLRNHRYNVSGALVYDVNYKFPISPKYSDYGDDNKFIEAYRSYLDKLFDHYYLDSNIN